MPNSGKGMRETGNGTEARAEGGARPARKQTRKPRPSHTVSRRCSCCWRRSDAEKRAIPALGLRYCVGPRKCIIAQLVPVNRTHWVRVTPQAGFKLQGSSSVLRCYVAEQRAIGAKRSWDGTQQALRSVQPIASTQTWIELGLRVALAAFPLSHSLLPTVRHAHMYRRPS